MSGKILVDMGGVIQLVWVVAPHIRPGGFSTLPSPVLAGLGCVLTGCERKLSRCWLFSSICLLCMAMVAVRSGWPGVLSMSDSSGNSSKLGSAGRRAGRGEVKQLLLPGWGDGGGGCKGKLFLLQLVLQLFQSWLRSDGELDHALVEALESGVKCGGGWPNLWLGGSSGCTSLPRLWRAGSACWLFSSLSCPC